MLESAAVPAPCEVPDHRARMREDVRNGLLRNAQKELPPTYFYDARGSQLFDDITRLDEYYPTRAELALLTQYANDIVRLTSARALAELGAGTATKSRVLLRALVAQGAAQYLPMDVDGDTLSQTAAELRVEFPALDVTPLVADMRDDVTASGARHPLLYAFLGSTIGNFGTDDAHDLLRRIRDTFRPTDRLLIGVDLIKDGRTLHAAYNDAQGVTAEFNLNVLRVLNRELHADFNLGAFRHRAFYNAAHARIEMHLDSTRAQVVHIPQVGDVAFARGESIRTEISCKYDRQSATDMLERAGFRLTEWMTAPQPLFALALAEPTA